MEAHSLTDTASPPSGHASVALSVIAQMREETADALGALVAHEPEIRSLDKPTS